MQLLGEKSWRGISSSDIVPLCTLINSGVLALGVLLILGNLLVSWGIATKPAPSLVQLVDGKSIATEALSSTYRTPANIQSFVKTSLGMMFSWNANLAAKPSSTASTTSTDETPAITKDPGVQIPGATGKNDRITTATWQWSNAFSEDLRTEFLKEIADMTPDGVFDGNAQSVLSFISIGPPKELKPGQWTVDVTANLMIYDATTPQGRAIPFNKTVYVRAVERTTDPLPDHSTPIQKAFYQVRAQGMEITEMRDLNLQQLNP